MRKLLPIVTVLVIVAASLSCTSEPDTSAADDAGKSLVRQSGHTDHSSFFHKPFTDGPAVTRACLECHKDPDFRVKHPKLFNYYQEFESSVHGVAGLDCIDCHGGDAEATDSDGIHKGVLEPVRFDRIPDTCGSCHGNEAWSPAAFSNPPVTYPGPQWLAPWPHPP